MRLINVMMIAFVVTGAAGCSQKAEESVAAGVKKENGAIEYKSNEDYQKAMHERAQKYK